MEKASPLTAQLFEDAIRRGENRRDCSVSDTELDNIIEQLLESTYNLIRLGVRGSVTHDMRGGYIHWIFPANVFGLSPLGYVATAGLSPEDMDLIRDRNRHIKEYVKQQFERKGFTCEISDFMNQFDVSIPIDMKDLMK